MAEAGLIPGRGQPSLPERGHGVYFAIQTPRGRSSSSAGGRRPRSPIATWPPKTSSGCCPCSCGPPRTHRREAGAPPFYSYPIAEGNLPPPPRLPPVNLLRPPRSPPSIVTTNTAQNCPAPEHSQPVAIVASRVQIKPSNSCRPGGFLGGRTSEAPSLHF